METNMQDDASGAFQRKSFERIERIALGTTAVIFGMFLTFFTGQLSPPDGIINPFWASLFGIGFAVEFTLFGIPTGLAGLAWGLFGIVIWPIVTVVLFQKLLRWVQAPARRPRRLGFYPIFLLTLLYNLPISEVEATWGTRLPIFIKYLDFGPR